MSKAVKRFARGGDAGGGTYNPDGDTFEDVGGDPDAGMDDWLNWGTDDYAQPDDEYSSDGLYSDPETTTIGGVIYTRQPDGSWADDEGWSYTNDEIQAGVSDPETNNTPGGENPADKDDFGNEREPEGNGSEALVNPNVTGGATTPGARADRNPGGTPATGIDKILGAFKKTDGSWDLGKLAAAGITGAGLAAIIGDKGKGAAPDNAFQGAIDMNLQYTRDKVPQDPNRRPGSGGSFLGAGRFGPKPEGIAAIPTTPAPNDAPYHGGVPHPATPDDVAYGGDAKIADGGSEGKMYKGGSKDFDESFGGVTLNGEPAHGFTGGHPVDDGGSDVTFGNTKPKAMTKAEVDALEAQFAAPKKDAPAQGIAAIAPKQNITGGVPDSMRSDWGSYFDNAKVGESTNWGGGTLTLRDDGQAVYKAKDAVNGGNVLNRASIDNSAALQSLMSSAPGIAKQWGEQYGVQTGNNENDQNYWNSVLPKGGYAEGGIAQAFAKGGPTKPRYLRGETDGMADQIKARIDGGQEARLAHGEFVIPADVVGHLGNGNSDAGAKKLYQMMDKIRVARTGNKKQGKQINPDKFMPGMGGKRMASGGITDVIPRFATGGTTTGVNNWAGHYATNLLSQGNALGNDMVANPGNYVYQGPRVAGTNALQQKAYDSALGMNVVNPNAAKASGMMEKYATKLGEMPAYQAAAVGSGYSVGPAYEAAKFTTKEFNQDEAKKYMNPYLKESLDPQLAEARRQADISRMTNAGRLVGSGAFGGGRQAVMEAEGDRNLGQNLAAITGKGYDTAYTNALTRRDQMTAVTRREELILKREIAYLQAQVSRGINVDTNKVKLAESAMKLRAMQDMAAINGKATQTVTPPVEPAGRAPDGQAFQK